ncbi:pyridoxal phosphate-dependent aminotransferase [Liquorilactobacillus capillatus]|uniref:Transaminase n=1 Tax=Liquorilactobacillus capillatus DSM 19910 TaxID=1423731 RepID=A0A0R1LZ03_9LACO|nr:pyridoxal phosphate-dependent aminotransferase [Liquorilactobacillus capillatus]KRL00855.1 transaminase [Liquorilactobacillus capillatus DSM 19910]
MKFNKSQILGELPEQFFAALVAKVNKKIAAGNDVINLGQGNPDQPTFDYIVKALDEAAQDPQNHKYSPFRGLGELKKAAAAFYEEEYGVAVDPEKEIAILGGSKIGLVELPWALMNPGERLLLPDPGYPDYLSGAALGKVDYDTVPLRAENAFLPNYNEIPEEVARRAKFIYLNYPNNPTGAVATKDFYEQTVAFAKKYNIGVVSDFAYGALGFDGYKNPSFLQAKGAKDVGIEIYTFSKTFNMAGWRLAFAIGNPSIIEALNLIQDHLFVSVFPAIQKAGIAALRSPQRKREVAALQALYQERRDVFLAEAAKIGWKAFVPGGTFYVWMPVPTGYTSTSFADLLLEKVDVAVAAGRGFGSMGDNYVRIGLLVDSARLSEAVHRIGKLHLF